MRNFSDVGFILLNKAQTKIKFGWSGGTESGYIMNLSSNYFTKSFDKLISATDVD